MKGYPTNQHAVANTGCNLPSCNDPCEDPCPPKSEVAIVANQCCAEKDKNTMIGGAFAIGILAIAALTAFFWIIGYSYGFSWYVDPGTGYHDKQKNFWVSLVAAIIIVVIALGLGYALSRK